MIQYDLHLVIGTVQYVIHYDLHLVIGTIVGADVELDVGGGGREEDAGRGGGGGVVGVEEAPHHGAVRVVDGRLLVKQLLKLHRHVTAAHDAHLSSVNTRP